MTWSPVTEERTVPEAIVEALAQAGVKAVLGVPGGLTGPIWKALHDHPTVRALQVREESIASYMAEAHGRLTGEPLVVMGQGEWIVGNAGQGYMEALLGSSPLLILTEMSDGGAQSHHAPYQSGSGDYGTWDTRTALAGVTKRVMVSYHPAQAVQHTQLALKHALTGAPGPVAVVFHSSSLVGSVGPTTVPRLYPTNAYLPRATRGADDEAVTAAAQALRRATRPVVLAGNGVRVGQACDSLDALARALDAPVATTAGGKGVFPETDPQAVGVIGPFGWASANAVVGDADVVLVVGSKLAPSDTIDQHPTLLDPSRQTLIQIDTEPLHLGWTLPVDYALLGDAATVMDALHDAYFNSPRETTGDRPGGAERVARAFSEHRVLDGEAFTSDAMPLAPQRLIGILEEGVTDDTIITCDAGENRLFMMQWYRSRNPGGYLQPAAGGGMGYAVPAAMGAKLARPEQPVVAVCGDGGFAMSVHALMTAVQERLPVTVVVLNNGALGWVLHGMGDKAVAAHFAKFDHAAIARAVGCEGVQVTSADELREALKRSRDTTVPFVIDVPTSLATSFRDVAHRVDG